MTPTRRPSLWRHPDFMKLWTAETISQLGSQVTLLGLPLIAVLVLHASAFQVGLLGTAEFLPFLVVGLPAGVWVDRVRRRPILIAADLGRALALATIPIAFELDALTLVQLYAVAFATGVLTVFFDVSYQSYLPSLVDRDRIVEGNSKLEISRSGAQLVGPGLAGALIDLVKAPVAITVDAVSFLGSAACIFSIRKQEPPPVVHADGERPRMRQEIAEGLRFVTQHPLLRPIAATTGSSNLFGAMLEAIVVLYAVRILGLRPLVIGLAFGLGNIGFLLGASLASRVADRIGIGRAIVLGIAVGAPGFALVPLAPRSFAFPFLVASQVLTGFGSSVYNINQVSLRQVITPERMLGRMNATMRFLVWGTLPIGALIGGALGSSLGLRPTLWIAAAGAFIPILFVARSPVRPLREIPDPPRDAPIEPDGEGERPTYHPREESFMGDPTPGPGPVPSPEPQPPPPQPPIPQPEPLPTPPPIPQPEPPLRPVPQPPPVPQPERPDPPGPPAPPPGPQPPVAS